MRDDSLPIHAVMPGKCFRLDTPDARHLPVFNQIEGLVVDRGITFGDLAGTIQTFTEAYFGAGMQLAPSPGLLPLHRAVGRVRGHLHHLPGRRVPDLLAHRLDRAGRLRHGRPGRLRRRGDRRRRVVRLRLRLRHRPAGADAPRQSPTCAPSSRTTSASSRSSDLAPPPRERPPCALRSAGSVTSPRSPTTSGCCATRSTIWVWWSRAIEQVGEGLEDVVVGRVLEIRAIKGADKIRLIIVDGGGAEPLEIVCGATNFEVGDRVPLAPVGADAARRLRDRQAQAAGRDLQRHAVLGQGARPDRRRRRPAGAGRRVTGRAGDAAHGGARASGRHRLRHHGRGQPSRRLVHGPASPATWRPAWGCPSRCPNRRRRPPSGWPVGEVASASVEAPDLCPRLTVAVLRDVTVGPSPAWLAQRLLWPACARSTTWSTPRTTSCSSGASPPTPTTWRCLPGRGLMVRRARPGESVETLDGVRAHDRRAGRSLGDTGEDCLICDAEGHAGRHRRHHGRRLVGDRRVHERGAARGGLLHPDGDRPHLQATGPAHGGLGPLRAGLSTRG